MAKRQKSEVVFSHLTGEDQDDLVWFFGAGQCAFERSVFGYQLERSETFTFGSRVCPKCKGRGFQKTAEDAIRETLRRFEEQPEREKQRLQEAIRAHKDPPPWYDDGRCERCDGSGWIPRKTRHRRGGPITAMPIHAELRPVPQEPASDDLERYGYVSDQVRRMTQEDIETLAAFFGCAGSRNEHDKDRGRIFGVLALTPAGKKLLKMAGKSENMTPPLVIENQATLELTQAKPNRRALLDGARKQAEKRLRRAEQGWIGVRPTGGRRRKRGLPRRLETAADVRMAARATSAAFRKWLGSYEDPGEDYRCAV